MSASTEEEGEKQAQELMSLIAKENKENGSDDHVPKVTAHYADVSDPQSVNACIAEFTTRAESFRLCSI